MSTTKETQKETKYRILPSDPIVLEKLPKSAVPFLTRFAEKPNIKIPSGIIMGNQTYMGVTNGTGAATEGDYQNDDQ